MTATLTRIRLLAGDLTRELARPKPARRAASTLTAAIYREADVALVALKTAKPSKR